MGQHDAFLDRMTARLGELEHCIAGLSRQGEGAARQRELETSLASLREQLQMMRRESADLTEDRTRSFAQAYERLNAAVGRAQAQGGGTSSA